LNTNRTTLIAALILLIAAATAYPQFQNWDDLNLPSTFIRGQPIENRVSSTTAAPTTASPRYIACVQSCPTTSEYNPICGSDNVNYYNEGKFNCALSCGQSEYAPRLLSM
ncbi:hypothetical protein KR222_002460, partial [Zaprionus bogoriensis]